MPFDGCLSNDPARGDPATRVAIIMAGWRSMDCPNHFPATRLLPRLVALLPWMRAPGAQASMEAFDAASPMLLLGEVECVMMQPRGKGPRA